MVLVLLLACRDPEPGGCEPTREVPYDGVDQDCDGADLTDVDRDGVDAPVDCDDGDPAAFPGAAEIRGDGVDQDCDGRDAPGAGTRAGQRADEGFGTAVAWTADERLVVGAPWGGGGAPPAGRVYVDGVVTLEGAPGDAVGAAVVAVGAGWVAGAPGRGAVLAADGTVLAEGAGLGTRLAAEGDTWVAAGAEALVWSDGREEPLPARPDALALGSGRLAVGWARGETAVWLDGAAIGRAGATDEAGAALAFVDLDGDGAAELLVGAPGAGRVYVVDPASPPATLADAPSIVGDGGRFGAALAGAAGVAWVGAPMHGEGVEGAVYRVGAERVAEEVARGAAGDQLGFSLAVAGPLLAAGAPGGVTGPGTVGVSLP